MPEKIVSKFQSSGCSRSRGYIVDLQESEIPKLFLDKIQRNGEDEVMEEKKVIPYQKIIYGAPGTGKSYSLAKDVKKYFENSEMNINDKKSVKERVTFYDGYTYGQFVGAYKPLPCADNPEEKNDITYKYIPGPIFRLLKEAYSNSNTKFILIIEEINRARADRVFGNIFQLLDRDEQSGESEYPVSLSEEQEKYFRESLFENVYRETIERKGGLYLPKNLYIWATMNSADQGVYPMDTAFKRRWTFSYLGLDENSDKFGDSGVEYSIKIEGDKINSTGEKIQGKRVEWNRFRKTVNNILLEERIPEDRLLAPFFIKKNDFEISSDSQLEGTVILKQDIFQSKILMYLFDDVLRHRGKKRLFSERINTFSNLISELKSGKRIFSEEFYQKIENREND